MAADGRGSRLLEDGPCLAPIQSRHSSKILIVYQQFSTRRAARNGRAIAREAHKKAPRACQRGIRSGAKRRAQGWGQKGAPDQTNAIDGGLFPAALFFESEAYCFFVIGVTGCEPPVDFGPGVTPALFSSFCVAVLELPAAVEPIFGVAPEVGPVPASLVDTAPLPASIFDCANAGAERPIATAAASKVVPNEDMTISLIRRSSS